MDRIMDLGLVLLVVALCWLGTSINATLAAGPSIARRRATLLSPLLAVSVAIVLATSGHAPVLPLWLGLVLSLVAVGTALPLVLRVRLQGRARRQTLRRPEDWQSLTEAGRVRGTSSTSIRAPQSAVFALLSNPAQASRWRGVIEVRGLLDGGLRAGSTWVQVSKPEDYGKIIERTFRMLIWEPPRRAAWQAVGDGRAAIWTLECAAEGSDATLVTLGQTFDPNWIYSTLTLVMPGRLTEQINGQLAGYLKGAAALLEDDWAPAVATPTSVERIV